MWILTWIPLLIFTSLSFTSGIINICSDQTEEGPEVNIYGNFQTRVKPNCTCVVTFKSSFAMRGPVSVKQNSVPLGCEYSLRFIQQLYPNNPYLYTCLNFVGSTFNLQANTEELYIDVVRGSQSSGGFMFNISLSTTTTPAGSVRVKCGPPDAFTSSTSTQPLSSSPSTVLTSTPGTSLSKTSINVKTSSSSTQSLLPSTNSISRTTSDIRHITTSSGLDNSASTINPGSRSPTTKQITTSTVVNRTETERMPDPVQNDSLPVIIGSAVGGTVFIVVCLIIILCFIKRKKSQKIMESEDANLTDVNNGYQHFHSTTDTLGYETVEHSPDGRPQITDTPEMEIIPNELYYSSDSLNQLDQPEVESTPNPSVEYAVVQKNLVDKPKISSNSKALKPTIAIKPQKQKKDTEDYENMPKVKFDLKPEVERIVGPEGDEYTLVNKT